MSDSNPEGSLNPGSKMRSSNSEDFPVHNSESLIVSLENLKTFGESFQLVRYDEKAELVLNTEELRTLLEQVRDKKVATLGISGVTRSGKGFLLSLLVDYLNWYSSGCNGSWPKPNSKLTHFHWQCGDRDTEGIYMWNKPFFLRHKTGEEFALLLMDTEGVFDVSGSEQEVSRIFTLSTLISSLQLFNLNQNITSVDLDNLGVFTRFVEATGAENTRIFQENQKQSTNYNELRCTFESLSCYLLPHPGPGVAENNDMDCTIGDMEIRSVFLEYIRSLFNDFLTEIPLKKMGEVEITGLSLFNIIENYFNSIKNGIVLPSLRVAHTRSLLHEASMSACREFINEMIKFEERYPDCKEEVVWKGFFERSKATAMKIFDDFPKLRDNALINEARSNLLQYIDVTYKNYNFGEKDRHNNARYWSNLAITALTASAAGAAALGIIILRLN